MRIFFFQWLLSWEYLLCNVDVGRAVPDYNYMHNKTESKFLTSQAEHADLVNVVLPSDGCLMMKCST